jgi:hypothetical protein
MGSYPLLVIFHDPPSFRDNPDPVTGKRELHNTWLVGPNSSLVLFSLTLHTKTDVTKKYIDWAVDSGFQVIDVNIPKVVSVEHVSHSKATIGATLTQFSLTQVTCGPTTPQHELCRPVSLRRIFGTIISSKWTTPDKIDGLLKK